jgi:hypothetical protein
MTGYPVVPQTAAPGADEASDSQKVTQGPFNATQRTSDGLFKTGPGFVHTMSFNNASGAAVTFSVYDDATSTANPIRTVTVAAGASLERMINATFFNGLRVTCTLWTSCICEASWK